MCNAPPTLAHPVEIVDNEKMLFQTEVKNMKIVYKAIVCLKNCDSRNSLEVVQRRMRLLDTFVIKMEKY